MASVCHVVEQIQVVAVGSQGNGCCIPGVYQSPYDLVCICAGSIALGIAGQLQLHILAAGIRFVVAIEPEGNGGAGLQGLAEVQAEVGPAVVGVACLQNIVAVYGSDFKIQARSQSSKGYNVALVIKANTAFNVTGKYQRLCCQNVINQNPGGNIAVLSVSHIVHKVQMVGFSSQGNSCCIPCFYHGPYNLTGFCTGGIILAVAGKLQLHVPVIALFRFKVAVELEADGGTGLQGLTEVHPEGGPAVAAVAQLQGIFAAVCGSGNAQCFISSGSDDGILSLALSNEQAAVAFHFKAIAFQNIAFRLNRLDGQEVIHVNLDIVGVDAVIFAVHGAYQVQMVAIICQHDLQAAPSTVRILACSIAAGQILKHRDCVADTGKVIGVSVEAQNSTGLQGLAEVDAEDRPCAVGTSQHQSIVAVEGHNLHQTVSPCVLASNAGKQLCVAGVIEGDALGEITGGCNAYKVLCANEIAVCSCCQILQVCIVCIVVGTDEVADGCIVNRQGVCALGYGNVDFGFHILRIEAAHFYEVAICIGIHFSGCTVYSEGHTVHAVSLEIEANSSLC